MTSDIQNIKFRVVELFDSIEGEGKRSGQPATFVRFAGCNLRCTYCDTTYALFNEKEPCVFTLMSMQEILEKINPSYKRATLTGGEPLINAHITELINQMTDIGIEVNIETNGAVDLNKVLPELTSPKKVFFTIDYKSPSSGVEDKMIWRNYLILRPQDVIKFVVGSDKDVNKMISVIEKIKDNYLILPHLYSGVVFGQYEPIRLVRNLLNKGMLKDVHYQVQLHKTVWTPETRGV